MGNMSQLGKITQAAVAVLFAELACMNAGRANQVMERFPGYRSAKGDPDHAFWGAKGIELLAVCRNEISAGEDEVDLVG